MAGVCRCPADAASSSMFLVWERWKSMEVNSSRYGLLFVEYQIEVTNGSGQQNLEIKGKGKLLADHDEASVRETRGSREIKGKGKAAVVFDEASFRETRASRERRESKGKGKDVIVDDEPSLGKTRASRKDKGKEKVVGLDKEEKYCAVVDNDGRQCGKPVKEGFEVCRRHLQNISPFVGRKRKLPVKRSSSSSRKWDGDHDQPDETPAENKEEENYYY